MCTLSFVHISDDLDGLSLLLVPALVDHPDRGEGPLLLPGAPSNVKPVSHQVRHTLDAIDAASHSERFTC